MATVMVEIPVDEATAAALTDPGQRLAVGEMVKALVRQRDGHDRLGMLLKTTRREAAEACLTDQDIDDELSIWKAERTASHG